MNLTKYWSNFPFHLSIAEIEAKYEQKMRQLREELELRRKTEIHEIEERKNSQINTLMRNHEKAFSDIKNYYNDITLNNLALINSLKVRPSVTLRSITAISVNRDILLYVFNNVYGSKLWWHQSLCSFASNQLLSIVSVYMLPVETSRHVQCRTYRFLTFQSLYSVWVKTYSKIEIA